MPGGSRRQPSTTDVATTRTHEPVGIPARNSVSTAMNTRLDGKRSWPAKIAAGARWLRNFVAGSIKHAAQAVIASTALAYMAANGWITYATTLIAGFGRAIRSCFGMLL
jgi:hypothetical protein